MFHQERRLVISDIRGKITEPKHEYDIDALNIISPKD